jgi:hypothetical protein
MARNAINDLRAEIDLKRMIGPRGKPFFIKWSHPMHHTTSARKSGAAQCNFCNFEVWSWILVR